MEAQKFDAIKKLLVDGKTADAIISLKQLSDGKYFQRTVNSIHTQYNRLRSRRLNTTISQTDYDVELGKIHESIYNLLDDEVDFTPRSKEKKPHPSPWVWLIGFILLIGGSMGIYFKVNSNEDCPASKPLEGRIMSNDQKPLANVTIILGGKVNTTVKTDNVGYFRFEKLPRMDTVRLQMINGKDTFFHQEIISFCDTVAMIAFPIITLKIIPDKEPEIIKPTPKKVFTMAGYVMDKITSQPLEGIKVLAEGQKTTTDENGFFSFNLKERPSTNDVTIQFVGNNDYVNESYSYQVPKTNIKVYLTQQ